MTPSSRTSSPRRRRRSAGASSAARSSRSTSQRRGCRSSLHPSGGLLDAFVDLNNQVLRAHRRGAVEGRRPFVPRRRPELDPQRRRGLRDDAARLCRMEVDTFYVQMASESDPERALATLGELATGNRRIFVGVIDPIDMRIETPEEVRDRILVAARYTSTPNVSGRPTTAGSRRSAMTRPHPATRHSRRSRRGSPERRWPRPPSESERPRRGRPRPGSAAGPRGQDRHVEPAPTRGAAHHERLLERRRPRPDERARGVVGLLGDRAASNRGRCSGRPGARTGR